MLFCLNTHSACLPSSELLKTGGQTTRKMDYSTIVKNLAKERGTSSDISVKASNVTLNESKLLSIKPVL